MAIKLSIIIPAHNEADRLPAVLKDYVRYFAGRMGDAFEILVVANHCSDSTAEAARQLAAGHPQIRVIEEERRIGKGGAVILGAKAAQGEWIGFVDADGATSPDEFARLFEVAQQADGVIGSRWLAGANVAIHQKWLRLLSSRVFNLFIKLLLGLNYKDTQCGAKIFRAEAWQKILPNIGITRFAFDVDILFQLRREKFRIIEEPTEWHDVAGSKVNILGSSLEMFLAIIRMRLLYSPLKPLVRLYERTIAKPVEFLLKDPLFRHTALLFSAFIITAFGNIGFQMVVGRTLPGSEYALLATFLALFAIISRPLAVLSTGINHYTSLLVNEGQQSVAGGLLNKWLLRTSCISVILSLMCIIFASRISAFFHLERVAPVVVSALALPAIFIAPVFGGALQGLQRFAWTSIAGITNATSRVVLGALLVTFLYPACGWALAGHVAGIYLAMFVSFAVLFPVIRGKVPDGPPVPSMRLYLLQCFFIQVSVAVLMTGDVVMVKHYIPSNTDFAYAATLGRMVAFIPAAVAMSMFPKVSSSGTFSKAHRGVYLRSQLYTASLVAIALAACILFPALMLRVLFRITQPSSELLSLTRWMAVVMAITTLLNINVCLLMAQRRFRLLMVTVGCASLFMAAVHFCHNSGYHVVFFAGVSNFLALVITTIGIFRSVNVSGTIKEAHEEGS